MAIAAGSCYEPSGRFSLVGPVLILSIGALAATVTGALYGYLIFYNPFLYINFLATIGFGVGVGMGAAFGVSAGKVRNPGLATGLGLLVGLLAVFASWVFWLHALTGSGEEAVWVIDASAFPVILARLAEQGVWSIRSLTPTGMALYAIWGVEALIVIGATAFAAHSAAARPFCERCEEWLKEAGEPRILGYADREDELRSELAAGRIEALATLSTPDAEHFSRCSLLHCADEDHPTYLSLANVAVTTDDKGKTEEKESVVIAHLNLSRQDVQRLGALLEPPAGAPPLQTTG